MPHPHTVLFLCPDWMKLGKKPAWDVICPKLVKFGIPVNFSFLRYQPQLPAPPQAVLSVFLSCVFLLPSDIISQQACVESWPSLKLQGPFPILQTSLESLTPRSCGKRANIAWTLSAGAQGSCANPNFLCGWDTRIHCRADQTQIQRDPGASGGGCGCSQHPHPAGDMMSPALPILFTILLLSAGASGAP